MSDTVVHVENLSKKYKLGLTHGETMRESVGRFTRKLLRRPEPALTAGNSQQPQTTDNEQRTTDKPEEFWALRDVSFEVKRGEVLGIIGRNGAGKSTLLKVLSQVTKPTSGRAVIKGRVGSLLEVGTGFHPELTGRENIYLNGTILGMKKAEIDRKFDEIVQFAGVETFIDTPVKRYSSGMKVRLGFAVAAHLEPEILIVDEVLAVGDAEFQKRCLGKMQHVATTGRTVLFVSHNMAAVKKLCGRGIVLEAGAIAKEADANQAVAFYLKDNYSRTRRRSWSLQEAPGNDEIRVLHLEAQPLFGHVLEIDSGVQVTLVFMNYIQGRDIDCAVRITTADDIVVLTSGQKVANGPHSEKGQYSVCCKIPPNLLNTGLYRITLIFGEACQRLIWKCDDLVHFEVANSANELKATPIPGIIRPNLQQHCRYLGPSHTPSNRTRRFSTR